MYVPGSNLLDDAFDLIETSTIKYRKFKSREANRVGIFATEYEPDVDVEGSVQAVDNDVYKQLGLDFQKTYVRVYLSLDVIDLDRDVSGDRFVIFGDTYQLTSTGMWYQIDGWVGIVAVKITE